MLQQEALAETVMYTFKKVRKHRDDIKQEIFLRKACETRTGLLTLSTLRKKKKTFKSALMPFLEEELASAKR